MGRVILGEMSLRWCPTCDLPIVEQRTCSLCGGATDVVKYTPPGDVRPAFEADIELTRNIIASQFGPEASRALLPPGILVVLNSLPALDRMDEVIVRGRVLGNLKYDIVKRSYSFIPRNYGLHLLEGHISNAVIVVDDDAVPFIEKGASCLAPGITKVIGEFEHGSEVLVTDGQGRILMSGQAQSSASEMRDQRRGMAVKSRRRKKVEKLPIVAPSSTDAGPTGWDAAVKANADVLESKVEKAKRFIQRVMRETHLPAAVSYSGGKDSLVTLLLVMEAGLRPDIMFIDTGIELPETLENVEQVVSEYGLNLVTIGAGDGFFRALRYFGPPSKDFRWCCKICKLGPATRLIRERYPDGLLSFIGQRRYESRQRMEKGNRWKNPWVPNQEGVSPIQDWNALTVWLYLFSRKAPYNRAYEWGMERIGCWLCPASDMADLRRIREMYDEAGRFFDFLSGWAGREGYSDDWTDMGLWRWKKYPGTVFQKLENEGLSGDDLRRERVLERAETGTVDEAIAVVDQKADEDGYSIVCKLEEGVREEEAYRLLPVLGAVSRAGKGGIRVKLVAGGLISVETRNFRIRANDLRHAERILADIRAVAKRGIHCLGCGVCTGRCPTGALSMVTCEEGDRVGLDESLCTSCRSCLGPCPVESFLPNRRHEL